jgi:microcystin-dependent protein
MAYNIPRSDTAAYPDGVTVEDQTLNETTSLTFVGKNYPEFAIPVGKNFLHLLENFANKNSPPNPIVGQLWYDTDSDSSPPRPQLRLFDGTNWREAGNIIKANTAPGSDKSVTGDLWVDTTNQQLYLYNGSLWVLVGPEFKGGTASGLKAEEIDDRDTNTKRTVLTLYINGLRVAIISKDEFFPKSVITGFEKIRQGVNLTTEDFDTDGINSVKFWGISEKSNSLIVGNDTVPAANFLRNDQSSTTNFPFNIRNAAGVRIGDSLETTLISTTNKQTILGNKALGSSIVLRTNDLNNAPKDVVTITGLSQVGINKSNPDFMPAPYQSERSSLDINGNLLLNGQIYTTDNTNSTSTITGSIVTTGGIGITGNAYVGGDINVTGHLTVGTQLGGVAINPRTNEAHDLGADSSIVGSGNKRFRNVYAKNYFGDSFTGSFTGNLTGSITGSAARLAANTVFRLTGDVNSTLIQFNGSQPTPTRTLTRAQRSNFTARVFTGAVDHQFQVSWFINVSCSNSQFSITNQPITAIGQDITFGYWFEYTTAVAGTIAAATVTGTVTPQSGGVFVTTISDEIINTKEPVADSLNSDYFLVYRASLSPPLRKISKTTLFQNLGTVPPGAVFPFAGATPPPGYLLCDGSEQRQSLYPELFAAIGYTYRSQVLLQGYQTFALPDLRGRFAIGVENMDNNNTVNIETSVTSGTRNAITTISAISVEFVVQNSLVINGPFQLGKVVLGHGLVTTNAPVVITSITNNTPSPGFTTIVCSCQPQPVTYPSLSGLTLTSLGNIDGGGGAPAVPRVPSANAPGIVGGSRQQTLTVNQLPQHSHDLIGSAGNQYYALRFAIGAPADSGAITTNINNTLTNAQLLPTTGDIDVVGAVGQPFDIMNPYQAINYVIFTGRIL